MDPALSAAYVFRPVYQPKPLQSAYHVVVLHNPGSPSGAAVCEGPSGALGPVVLLPAEFGPIGGHQLAVH
ncbi:hypothetical protein EYF80_048880 [Liparis tanakae]|uniref:Uncharacterized protein n=1 Tax=Liparis tanakae TaxID=230148 RepID=A0A4Z2FJ67_9TELE|nr:hypothetical protein EYF80_048880 [Liparis tanakae]